MEIDAVESEAPTVEVEQASEEPKVEVVEEVSPVATPKAQSNAEVTYNLPDIGVDSAESDKASVEVPAPVSGKVVKLLVNAGDTVSNGQEFIVIVGGAEVAPQVAEKAEPTAEVKTETVEKTAPTPTAPTKTAKPVKLSEQQVNAKLSNVYAGPAVRKLARQMGIDITQIQGTAINQRIIKEDIFAYVEYASEQSKRFCNASAIA